MKKNTSWKFTDELSVTFQLSVSGPGEFGLRQIIYIECRKNSLDFYYMLIMDGGGGLFVPN